MCKKSFVSKRPKKRLKLQPVLKKSHFANEGQLIVEVSDFSRRSLWLYALCLFFFSKTDLTPLKEAEIVVGDYNLMAPYLYQLPNLKWMQGTWAGLDSLWPHIDKKAPPKFPITRTSGENFGRLMREYVIANMVFWERNYFKVRLLASFLGGNFADPGQCCR